MSELDVSRLLHTQYYTLLRSGFQNKVLKEENNTCITAYTDGRAYTCQYTLDGSVLHVVNFMYHQPLYRYPLHII